MDGLTIRAQAVLAVVPMLDVLRELGAAGGIYGDGTQQIKCPLHDDRHPSARLYVGEGSTPTKIYCFTCGKNFDVIDLVRGKYHLTFAGGIEWLEAHFTVPLPSANLTSRIAGALRQHRPVSTEALVQLAESAITTAREQLGVARTGKAYLALDLALYRYSKGRLDYLALQSVVDTVMRRTHAH